MTPVAFDQERINALLARVDQRLRDRGVAGDLYLVGGAAIALTIADRRVTQDIDARASGRAVLEEAKHVAEEEHLPTTWLNESARCWIPPRPPMPPMRGPGDGQPGLTIRIAPPEHLLAMKMVALRARDLEDILALVDHLGMREATAADYAAVLHAVYDGEDQLQDMLNVAHDLVETEALRIGEAVEAAVRRSPRDKAGVSGRVGRPGRS